MKKYDFRSDTVTKPTPQMRQAMFEAEVGDDVYGDDPTVNQLEKYCAQLMGKEAALFVCSGTMGNQLAILSATQRGDQYITHDSYHTVTHEVGALAVLSGVFPKTIKNDDYCFTASELADNLTTDDIHEPPTTLVGIENATGHGTVWPLEQLKSVYQFAKDKNLHVHMDGARIFNAAIASDCTPKDIAAYCDSLMFCLSKGLCAPVGSMLCGSKAFIQKARKYRKMLGGGLRQAGILAAAGLLAVSEMPEQLKIDHQNAVYLGQQLTEKCEAAIIAPIQINMVFFRFLSNNFDHPAFHQYLANHDILINNSFDVYRLVTSHEINQEDIDYLVKVIRDYIYA